MLRTQFQSTHPLRDATTQNGMPTTINILFQSTHPLRDATVNSMYYIFNFFLFQSTHPLRDATEKAVYNDRLAIDFNPRTPYGMRRRTLVIDSIDWGISIHAPLTGCDQYH